MFSWSNLRSATEEARARHSSAALHYRKHSESAVTAVKSDLRPCQDGFTKTRRLVSISIHFHTGTSMRVLFSLVTLLAGSQAFLFDKKVSFLRLHTADLTRRAFFAPHSPSIAHIVPWICLPSGYMHPNRARCGEICGKLCLVQFLPPPPPIQS